MWLGGINAPIVRVRRNDEGLSTEVGPYKLLGWHH